MDECSYEKLLQLVDRKLGPTAQLRVYQHLHSCDICRDTMGDIVRDRRDLARLPPAKEERGIPTENPKGAVETRV